MTALDRLRDHAEANNLALDWANRYGEPQYAVKGEYKEDILLCDWNDVPKDLQEALEKEGYDLLWEDEWYLDGDASTVWRSEPDSYWWRPSIAYTEEGVLTPDHDPMDWLEEFGNTDTVIPERAPLPEGFVKVAQVPYTDLIPPVLRALMEVWPHVLCQYGSDSAIHFYAGKEESDD